MKRKASALSSSFRKRTRPGGRRLVKRRYARITKRTRRTTIRRSKARAKPKRGSNLSTRRLLSVTGPETKYVATGGGSFVLTAAYYTVSILSIISAVAPTVNAVGTGDLTWPIQGVKQGQRVGNRITLKRWRLTLMVDLRPSCSGGSVDTDASNGYTRPTHVVLYMGYHRTDAPKATTTNIPFSQFYQDGNLSVAARGTRRYVTCGKVNTDEVTVVRKWRMNIIPTTNSGHYFQDGHDRYLPGKKIVINMLKYQPRVVIFDDDALTPTNTRNYFFWIEACTMGYDTDLSYVATTIPEHSGQRLRGNFFYDVQYIDP